MVNSREVIRNSITGDEVVSIKHSSGLQILICKMEGFSTTEVLFGTKYGSINTMFKTMQDSEYTTVPEGIAHFLEHKLFENEDTDVFELYAKTGASANAFTSFDKTCYLFSCSENFADSLRILLSFVQEPYFTKENVDKEQGIIGQEIQMCNDNPSWKVFFNLLRGMYHNHPVKIDIAGTIESIAQIDYKLLYKCYNTFYNLNNMVLSVAGNVDEQEVLTIADELLKPCKDIQLKTAMPQEPSTIVCSEVEETIPVGTPIFSLGFKSKPEVAHANLKAELEAYVLANVLIDVPSPTCEQMLRQGLINSTLEAEVFNGDGFFSTIISGQSESPKEVRDRLFKAIADAKANGIDRQSFEAIKKSIYGDLIKEYNNVSSVANELVNSYFSGVQPFESLNVLSSITYQDVQDCLQTRLNPEYAVLSVIKG